MTKNEEYFSLVEKGEYPKDRKIPLDNNFVNHNGVIQNLALSPINSVAIIKSVKGSVRANHLHVSDYHAALVLKGQILYFERPSGSLEIPKPILYKEGDMFFTPPGMEHAMVFPEEAEFLTLAKNIRTHENHEADVRRVKFITQEILENFLGSYQLVNS